MNDRSVLLNKNETFATKKNVVNGMFVKCVLVFTLSIFKHSIGLTSTYTNYKNKYLNKNACTKLKRRPIDSEIEH